MPSKDGSFLETPLSTLASLSLSLAFISFVLVLINAKKTLSLPEWLDEARRLFTTMRGLDERAVEAWSVCPERAFLSRATQSNSEILGPQLVPLPYLAEVLGGREAGRKEIVPWRRRVRRSDAPSPRFSDAPHP